MRVLLVHPDPGGAIGRLIRLPPLGLAYVAGALRAAGHQVRILDAAVCAGWRSELQAVLAGWQPRVVGISASTAVIDSARALAARIKQADPGTLVLLGGVHATLFPGEVLATGEFDLAVHGEGELTAVELLAAVEAGREPDGIPGVAHRSGGNVRVNARRPPIADLDDLPPAAYDLLPQGLYSTPFSSKRHVTSLVSSRGCPYSCSFCDASVVHGRRYRTHSAERVVGEIRQLADRFAIREVLFKDSEFTLDRARTERFCDLLVSGGPRVAWTCSARVDRVDGPLLRKMAAAGCRVIQFGVESADPAVTAALKKRITVEQVRGAFRACRAAGIETVANLMVGTPEETEKSIASTLRLVREIRPDHLNVQRLVLYPGTELHRTLQGRSPVEDGEARRRRRRLLRAFYLRPTRVLARLFSTDARLWLENLAAAAQLLAGGD
ncbi:MAG TPA: radical SAM protein [Vicinamibacteria bacterium]|nr:radical SAM protein [Vicinamibacteria bacterium]